MMYVNGINDGQHPFHIMEPIITILFIKHAKYFIYQILLKADIQ